MSENVPQPADNNDPLARLIKQRHPDLGPDQILVLKLEWWSLYGNGFNVLGAIAADAVEYIDRLGPEAAIRYVEDRLIKSRPRSPARYVLEVFEQELREPLQQLLRENATREEVYDMLVDLMKLGRREIVPLD